MSLRVDPRCKDFGHGHRQTHPAPRTRSPSKCAGCTKAGDLQRRRKATRKDRVAKAKDALARSVGARGEQVAPARAARRPTCSVSTSPSSPTTPSSKR